MLMPSAQAQTTETLVSNTTETRSSTGQSRHFGVKFTTGSSSKGYTLSDVQLWVETGNANTVVSIRAGSGTNPGTLIATLTNPNSFTNDALNTFTAPANTILNANTTYFLVVNDGIIDTDVGDRAEFATTNSEAETGAEGWSIANENRFFSSTFGFWASSSGVPSLAIRGQTNPVPGVITVQPADTVVTEGDMSDTATFTAVLNTEPTSAVTVTMTTPAGLALDGPDGATAFTESEMLTFATDAWDTPQTVTVRATDDNTDSPQQVLAVTYSTTSSDDDYSGLTGTAATVTVNDDDPTVVSLARLGSTGSIEEGENVEFTVTLGRALIAGEIIDVPLIVSGTNITTADWSLSRKSGNSLNTGVTLVNETTATPVVRFSGVGAQTATLTLTTIIDNMAETGDSEMLTLALGTNNAFDLNTRMTNVGGGADPNSDATKNTFSVTINDVDNEAPMPSLLSLEAIDEQCELTMTQLDDMAPSATDNHPGTVTVTNNIGRFPIMSDTTITWTYTDAAGNTSTQTQQVTIMDTTPPSVTGTLNEVMEQCEVAVVTDLTVPTAADNCDSGAITATTDAAFPITSTTTITWTYTDAAGNTSTQTQQVTIMDTTDPVPMEADLPMLEACSQVTSLTAPTATDNCDGTITGTTTVTPPITASTTLTWTYTDAAGNAVTQMQEVVVNSDVLIPDVPSLPTLTDQCRIAALSSPTAKNCSGNTITATTTATLPITTNSTIMWTYTDAGNSTTQTQEVMIMDTMNPVPDNTLSALTAAGSLAQADVTVPTATDNCDGQIMASQDVNFPITSDATITWTYTDAAGNTATQTQQVTITAAPLSAAEDAAEAIIFPNPSGDYLEVRSPVSSTFQLLSLSGKPLLEGTTNTKTNVTSLQSGLYLVQLPDGSLLKFVRE